MATDANGNVIPNIDPQLAGILNAMSAPAWPRPGKKAAGDVVIPPPATPPNTDADTNPANVTDSNPPVALNPERRFNPGQYAAPSLVDPATGLPSATSLALNAPTPMPLQPGSGAAPAPNVANLPTTQTAPPPPTASGSSVVPNALPFNRWSLTRPVYTQSTSDPLSGQITTPSYLQTSADPVTGMPTAAGPQTKLGKLLSILRGAGIGAAIGSTQPTFGRGLMAANEWVDQQARQRQQLQMGGLQAMMARQQMQLAPQELALRQAQMAQQQALLPLQQGLMQAQLTGVHSYQTYRDPQTGDWMQQAYDINNKPVGQPTAYAPKNMREKAVQLINPADTEGLKTGVPTPGFPLISGSYDPAFGQYYDQGRHLMTNAVEFNRAAYNKATPAAGSTAAAVVAQAGAGPGANATPDQQAAYGQRLADIQARMKREGSTSFLQPDELNTLVSGVRSGALPPDVRMLGLGRGAGGQLEAELTKQGFNLAQANQDWTATRRYLATMNGGQQVLFQQRVRSAGEMLNNVDQLYRQWQQTGLPTGFKTWNRAALQAAKNLPGQSGAVAQALDTQIAELTADLATVYMGGSSPSDKGIGLAHEVLSGDWNQDTFEKALQQARTNVAIRINSVNAGTPMGVSPNNPYMAPTTAPAAPQTPTTTPPAQGQYPKGFRPG